MPSPAASIPRTAGGYARASAPPYRSPHRPFRQGRRPPRSSSARSRAWAHWSDRCRRSAPLIVIHGRTAESASIIARRAAEVLDDDEHPRLRPRSGRKVPSRRGESPATPIQWSAWTLLRRRITVVESGRSGIRRRTAACAREAPRRSALEGSPCRASASIRVATSRYRWWGRMHREPSIRPRLRALPPR